MTHPRPSRRRGSVIIAVMWAIAIAALVATSVQLFAFRQASLGREAEDRVQARWAARAGLEETMAVLALHTEQPIPDDAFAIIRDLEYVSTGDFAEASYEIRHHVDGKDWSGPLDEHSRLNVNAADQQSLVVLDDITPDVISAIDDWKDEDDEPGFLGSESDYYLGQSTPYQPRNGPLRSVAEMELIAGIWGDFVRGEDWNLNNRLDPNEDDGSRTLPEDEPDGILDSGWAGRLTVYSVDDGASASGLPRMYLRRADPEELMARCDVDQRQAEVLIDFGHKDDNVLSRLLATPLTQIDPSGNVAGGDVTQDVTPLDQDQLRLVLAECSMRPTWDRASGRTNLNTAHPDLVRDLLELRGFGETIADEIIYMRNSRPQGITSLMDLFEIPDLTPDRVVLLAGTFMTHSNVYTVTSRGRSKGSGVEVEIIAVVDRSTVPVRILEYREQ